jgi:hypothetical protein
LSARTPDVRRRLWRVEPCVHWQVCVRVVLCVLPQPAALSWRHTPLDRASLTSAPAHGNMRAALAAASGGYTHLPEPSDSNTKPSALTTPLNYTCTQHLCCAFCTSPLSLSSDPPAPWECRGDRALELASSSMILPRRWRFVTALLLCIDSGCFSLLRTVSADTSHSGALTSVTFR